MHDPAALFAAARRRLPDAALLRVCGGWRGKVWARWRNLLGLWPVQLVGERHWEPLPEHGAQPSEERLILAVRAGWFHPARIPGVVMDPVLGLPAAGQQGRIRGFRAIWGEEIVDLVAVPPKGSRDVPRLLIGAGVALGDAYGLLADGPHEDEPVPLARTVGTWLARAAEGAVLPLGEPAQQAAYLRGIAAPLVAEDLAHGLALERLLKRPPVPEPRILVRQANGRKAA